MTNYNDGKNASAQSIATADVASTLLHPTTIHMYNQHPPIVPLGPEYAPQLYDLWLASVRATHHFLREQDIVDISAEVHLAFAAVPLFGILQTPCTAGHHGVGASSVAAFIGISAATIEMLFVHPHFFRHGYGKALVDYALAKHDAHYVDVNEQNPAAAAFYARMGFVSVGRDILDTQGRPFPILHLRHRSATGDGLSTGRKKPPCGLNTE